MSRNMRLANEVLFRKLIENCAARGIEILRPTAARWVASTPESKEVLKKLRVIDSVSFGRFRNFAALEYDETYYFSTIGFEESRNVLQLPALEDTRGYDVCLLSELPVQPRSGPAKIRNVVEFGSNADHDYTGHDSETVMDLYPEIRIYVTGNEPLQPDIIWPACLCVCAAEAELLGSWIERELGDSLEALANLAVPSLPYRELSRAVLDLDPRSLYMALYRCIEATYAYEHASKLANALSIDRPWHQVASALQAEMGWHPSEASSLNVALSRASENDLLEVCSCLDQDVGKDLRASAGKAIYRLRNQIVHYRPTTDGPGALENLDWNKICNLLVTIALHVFHPAYE